MEWISVKKRLPEKQAIVLGYDEFYGGIHLCAYYGRTDDEGLPMVESHHSDDVDITHWMPLPEPPK